jgi:hypothetical protein
MNMRKDQHAAFCDKAFSGSACRRIARGGVREQYYQLDRQPAEPDRDCLRQAQRHSAAADA